MTPLLQRRVAPRDPRVRRLIVAALAAVVIVVAGWLGAARPSPARLLATGPGLGQEYAREVERLLAGAERRVWVALYVLRPDRDGPVNALMDALAAAAARGVDVRVGLDGGPDPFTGRDDGRNRAAAEELAARGVRVVWDEDRRTTHAKLVVIDSRWVVAGSQNWTRAALTTNREAALLIDDPACAVRAEALLAGIPGW